VEGTSDCHEPQAVMGRWSRQSRRLPHDGASDDAKASKRRVTKVTRYSAEEEEATGVSEARSKTPSTVGLKRPRSQQADHREVTARGEAGTKSRYVFRSDPPKRLWVT
jgi:hypothetical protein